MHPQASLPRIAVGNAYDRAMTSNRRIPRSRRALGATALLITAVVAAIAGILVATVPVLIGATAYATASGIVAARLLHREITQVRRDWAHDRASVADGHRRAAVTRAAENTAFAEQMGSRLRLREAQLATLRDLLLTAEIDVAKSRERLADERARSIALEEDVDSARSDLESARSDLLVAQDALAASESAELQARAEILAWEESATEDTRRLA